MASPRLARRVWTCASWRIGALLGGQPCEHLLPSPEHFDPAPKEGLFGLKAWLTEPWLSQQQLPTTEQVVEHLRAVLASNGALGVAGSSSGGGGCGLGFGFGQLPVGLMGAVGGGLSSSGLDLLALLGGAGAAAGGANLAAARASPTGAGPDGSPAAALGLMSPRLASLLGAASSTHGPASPGAKPEPGEGPAHATAPLMTGAAAAVHEGMNSPDSQDAGATAAVPRISDGATGGVDGGGRVNRLPLPTCNRMHALTRARVVSHSSTCATALTGALLPNPNAHATSAGWKQYAPRSHM
eukprot:XP_001695007.1 predicted protein [Chlamydomonas reinhardtii]